MIFTLLVLPGEENQAESIEMLNSLLMPENIVLITDKSVQQGELKNSFKQTTFLELSDNPAAAINQASGYFKGDYVIIINKGDSLPSDYFKCVSEALDSLNELPKVFMTGKKYMNGSRPAFSNGKGKADFETIDIEKQFYALPYFFSGTFIRTEAFLEKKVNEELPYDYEKEFILRSVIKQGKVFAVWTTEVSLLKACEGDPTFYFGVYEEGWYRESVHEFWISFLKDIKAENGYIPELIQYLAIYCLSARFLANMNNTNKHLIPESEAYDYMRSFAACFKYIDDATLLNGRRLAAITDDITLKQLFLRIKYNNDNLQFDRYIFKSKAYLGYGNVLLTAVADQTVNIKFMEYKNNTLEIDASVSSILDFDRGELVIRVSDEEGEVFITPQWDEIYSLTKCFGVSYTKRKAFHASIPVKAVDRQAISFMYRKDMREWKLIITYASHFSRLCKRFKNSYWNINNKLMARHVDGDIVIYRIRRLSVYKRELKLLLEMFTRRDREIHKYAWYRIMSFIYGLFYGDKKIWLYIDKIYKAGDSSEYLYKYAVSKNDRNIKHYYLVDKNASDYKRLKKEGYKPLVRGTFKHRMVFLLADTVVISNSTVFAYNDYTLATSAYIRDLVHFRVACVQHGMSVQNIAVAQNRLRDNISLYFCASPYEIKNLSRPVYGYVGRDVLKLTGVPRYDGLVDRQKKQILLSPTWRMQAAVPVTKNEGVARDYNPLFKETSYYKVYNRLINNERLIAAAKEYGYRIVYVLHPIVSPQAEDFDPNPYVDVVPAIGDMSYEKVFCESSLMVTDFSGVQFDFAYMRKPIVYYHSDELPPHYDEGGFIYDTMGFGEICKTEEALVDMLCEYMKNGCKMSEKYIERADDFFAYSDHDNCKRIYEEMIKQEQ